MKNTNQRLGAPAPKTGAEPRLATQVATMLASDKSAGVRLKMAGGTYAVTCRDRPQQCATLAEVHSLLRQWSGQP